MKELIQLVIFLLIFFVVFFLLLFSYNEYLHHYNSTLSTIDPYTELVARQASSLLNLLGFQSQTVYTPKAHYVWIFIDGKYPAKVNEGCNALSVIIIYVSFIIAMAKGFKKTFLFILISLAIIYVINLARVAWLSYIFLYHEDFGKTAHDLLFPAIVYGTIIVFWFIWVYFFKLEKKWKKAY